MQFKTNRVFKLSKVNWDLFKEEASSLSESLPLTFTNFDDDLDSFNKLIKNPILKAGGKVNNADAPPSANGVGFLKDNACSDSKKFPDAIWWNEECSDLVQRRRNALKSFKLDPTFENLLNFKKISKETSASLKLIKRNNFREFISTMNPSRPIVENFRIIKKFKNRLYNPYSKSMDSQTPDDNIPLLEAFEKIASNYQYENIEIVGNENHLDSVLQADISLKEVFQAIKGSKQNLAPGIDGISYKILKNLPVCCIHWLTSFYNHMFKSGSYPSQWKEFKICFISKGKDKGYRPISLASTLLKTLERCLNDRLMWWCEDRGLLPKSFNGFR